MNLIRHIALETLEQRRLLAVTTPEFLVVANSTQNFSDTRRAVSYYDVSDVASPSFTGINETAAFSIWTGYEDTAARNFEEISGLAVNPANGDTYFLAFDSGTPGTTDGVGDGQGDYDLYRKSAAQAYLDLVGNGRAPGIMYTNTVTTDGFDYEAAYGALPLGPTGLPAVTSSMDGVPPGRNNTDADPSNDFYWLDGVVEKIGEIARQQDTPFFNEQTLEFVDPETLLLMENKRNLQFDTLGNPLPRVAADDNQIRVIKRVSTSPGAATATVDAGGTGFVGGYNNQTTESWESFDIADTKNGLPFLAVDMDFNTTTMMPLYDSNVDGMRFVNRNGVTGVWVSERDGGGDDFSFFELDLVNLTGFKKELQIGAGSPYPLAFALDDNPVVDPTTNDGSVDFFDVDEFGNLVIGESGFFDTPQTQPKIITREVLDYDAADSDTSGENEIEFGAWDVLAPLSPTLDDNGGLPIDGRFAVYAPGSQYVYYLDIAGTNPTDLYVYDTNTETFIYEELDAITAFLGSSERIRAFRFGDNNGDGLVTAEDIDALAAAAAGSDALEKERLDLTGDDDVVFSTAAGSDASVLVRTLLGTEFGDADLDGDVDFSDFNTVLGNFGVSGPTIGWASGNFDGDNDVDFNDFNTLLGNFGFVPVSAPVTLFSAQPVVKTDSLVASRNDNVLGTSRARGRIIG
ncbi:MAG: hypothetical protein ACFCVE_06530 [Phycisphaerae bacterium]